MPYVSPEVVQRVKQIDLLTYERPGAACETDHMINWVSQNWENGVRTHIFLDEFHTLLQHKYSANFFDSANVKHFFTLLGKMFFTPWGCGRNPGPNEVINRRRSRTCIPTKTG